jgi:hypothetical protein
MPSGEIDETDRVRPQNAHLARRLDQLLLSSCALLAGLAVAAREHDGGRGAGCRKLAHRHVRAFGTEQHDTHVSDGGKRADVGIARERANPAHLWADRIDGAGKAVLQELRDRTARGLGRIGGGSDDGDAARPQELRNRITHIEFVPAKAGTQCLSAGFPLARE